MPKIIFEKLEIAARQIEHALKIKGLEDVDLIHNQGACALGEIAGARKDSSWSHRLVAYQGNSQIILAEFQRASDGLEITIQDTSYSREVSRILEKYYKI